jgi:hypothetical protein
VLNSDIVLPLFLLFVKGFYRLFYEFFVKEDTHVLNVLNVLKADNARRGKDINFFADEILYLFPSDKKRNPDGARRRVNSFQIGDQLTLISPSLQ